MSDHDPESKRGSSRWRPPPLAAYLASAVLVRSASGGAAVGLVSMTVSGKGSGGGALLGGLLAALLTAPNLAGPWLARLMEGARDSRPLLAGAFACYGLALGGGALLLGRAPMALVAVLVAIGGLCSPLMTGGLSSRLTLIIDADAHAQRRAEGWDSATYGAGNIAGPATVAGLTVAAGPLAAVLTLSGAAVLAGLAVLLLPVDATDSGVAEEAMSVHDTLKVVAGRGPLRRVLIATMLTSLGTGGILVTAVVIGGQLRGAVGAGAALGAAYGVGSLCGALTTGAVPLRGEPERLAVRLVAVNAVAVALCALAPTYLVAVVAFAVAGASGSVLFTATLAVRSVYSPPNARAQVFVIMAAFKTAMGSAGTALAGALVGIGPRLVLVLGALTAGAAFVAAVADRRFASETGRDDAHITGSPDSMVTWTSNSSAATTR